MKVSELLGNRTLCEEDTTTLIVVTSLDDLKDVEDEYYTGEVNVAGNVFLNDLQIKKFPVKFGKVGGHFHCYSCLLTTLQGAPRKVGGNFYCDNNDDLTSLEKAPQIIERSFSCESSNIASLEGIHKIIKKIKGTFDITDNPIKSGGIGLLLIEELYYIRSELPAFDIINKYLKQGKKGLLLCQEELIEAGFEEYAKL